MLFPTSIANSLIAVGTDGLQERDRMVRAAIAIVCELGEYITVPPIAHLVPGPLLRISHPPLSPHFPITLQLLLSNKDVRRGLKYLQ